MRRDCTFERMARPGRDPNPDEPRFHFIVEWAERRQKTQADIARALGADKATVSAWFAGQIPRKAYLEPLAGYLEVGEPVNLFRDPDDDWLARFFRDRDAEERKRIQQALETLFPKKVA